MERDLGRVEEEALGHLVRLLRFDTTNPPGNETPAAEYLAGVLREAGVEARVLESAPGRGSCVARIPGGGEGGPLLLTSHIDVVPADPARWTRPPFSGDVADGAVWGRGALDMKSMTAYGLSAMLLAARERWRPRRDLLFAAVADEEDGGEHGMGYLVREHPDRVRAEFALNEVGGFTFWVEGERLYPVQVAQKGFAWLRLGATGSPGHGAVPREDNALVRLAEAVARLGRATLTRRHVPEVDAFLREMARSLPFPRSAVLGAVRLPGLGDWLLPRVAPDRERARLLAAALHDTVSPTIFQAGFKSNVIPGEAWAVLDGRFLPGSSAEALAEEVRRVVGPGFDVTVERQGPPTVYSPDTPLFRTIRTVVEERDPGARVVPYMVVGFTDSFWLDRLGVTTYGFAPVRLPRDVAFASLYHGIDERIPVEGFRWGLGAFLEVVERFAGPTAAARSER
ncbi:MAG: M20/M25/M40 family metallo-hydrolase [Planctomycetes bacterium]|nr:M20/M25/M40 family metallo-hydrolase [Planctomycetota bacterium]